MDQLGSFPIRQFPVRGHGFKTPRLRATAPGSVPEMAGSGEDHGHAPLVGRANDLLIAHRTTGLDGSRGTGLGLGIFSGGRLLTGNSGLAGELGHITVERAGIRCGCGNQGCLETVATDSAFAREISQILGAPVGITEAIETMRIRPADTNEVVERTIDYLAIAVAAVINVFNPSTLFLHGMLAGSDPAVFDRVLDEVKKRTLKPSLADCRILQSQGNKRLGAAAGIILALTDDLAPSMASFESGSLK